MQCSLRYGAGLSLEFDLPAGAVVSQFDGPHGAPLPDLRASAIAALAEPIGMPPCGQCVTPGDKVALALEPGTPAAGALVAAMLDVLLASGVAPRDVCVVCGAAEPIDPRDLLSGPVCRDVRLVVHDPATRDRLGLVGYDRKFRPIFLNRELGEADFVVPIGSIRPWLSASYLGVCSGLFPTFSDLAAQKRLPASSQGGNRRGAFRAARREALEAAWQLGISFTLQVVPAGGDACLHVLAGDPTSVENVGRKLSRKAWSFESSGRAALVVATIEGPPAQQSWPALGRALRVAVHETGDDGAVLVCCKLAGRPGPAIERLAGEESPYEALRQMRREPTWPDRVAAGDVARAAQRTKVYLLSDLDPSLVEDLHMAPVADAGEAARFIARHESATLIANAHLAAPCGAARTARDVSPEN